MTWIHFSSSQCKYSPHPGGRLQLKHCYIWSPISIKLFETCYQLLSQSQVRLNTSFRIFNAWSYLRISARLLVGWYNCITSQSGRQGTYLARGLVGDSADDPLDALHPHLQLHAGVTAHCPHTVLLLCWPWLSTCPLAAAAGPGSRYPPHISLTVRPEQVVAVLSWGSAGCYVWLFTVTDDDDITLPVLTRDQSAQSVLSSALLCFTRTCFLHFAAACESHASSSSGGDHWRAAVRPSQHSPCSLLGSAATWNR